MLSLSASRYQLANALKAFRYEWDATETVWRDVVRQDCADTYWNPLTIRVASLLTAVDRLDQVLAQKKRDCE